MNIAEIVVFESLNCFWNRNRMPSYLVVADTTGVVKMILIREGREIGISLLGKEALNFISEAAAFILLQKIWFGAQLISYGIIYKLCFTKM